MGINNNFNKINENKFQHLNEIKNSELVHKYAIPMSGNENDIGCIPQAAKNWYPLLVENPC